MAVVAIEEHFTSPQLRKLIAPRKARSRRCSQREHPSHQRHGRGRHRPRGAVRKQSGGAQPRPRDVGDDWRSASNDFLHETIQANPAASRASPRCRCPTRKPRPTSSSAASPGSASRRHDDGHDQGPVPRRQEVPAGVRARAGARRADLHPSVADASPRSRRPISRITPALQGRRSAGAWRR